MSISLNAGEAVLRVLQNAGVRHVFGLLGGSMMELYDALYQQEGVRYVGARDERAAALMADGYARISGRPSVVLGAQAGPGAVNLVTGIAEAHLAYSPLVAIAGMVPRGHCGLDVFQELDQQALFSPICKRSFVVPSAERLPGMLAEALRLAISGRPGPVVLNVPRDLFAETVAIDPGLGRHSPSEGGAPRAERIEQILDLLEGAEAPVILAGGGIKWGRGGAALDALARQLEIPVVASVGHGDVLPGDHPLFAGQMGPRGNAPASRLVRETDLLIALGTRLGFNSTFYSHDYVTARGKIIQVDIEPSALGRYFPVALGLAADATATAEALLAAARARAAGRGRLDGRPGALCRRAPGAACSSRRRGRRRANAALAAAGLRRAAPGLAGRGHRRARHRRHGASGRRPPAP